MSDVVVVDYGIGNVFSVCHAIQAAGGKADLTSDPRVIEQAQRVVLPGVGAFRRAAEALEARQLSDSIRGFVATGRPFLGLCLGMQLLFDSSSENGEYRGLGLIAGRVDRIPNVDAAGGRLRVPHIGWTELDLPSGRPGWTDTILAEVVPGQSAFYFVHSYAAHVADKADVLAVANHGGHQITAAVGHRNIYGVQFHPERSGPAGQRVLRRFLAA